MKMIWRPVIALIGLSALISCSSTSNKKLDPKGRVAMVSVSPIKTPVKLRSPGQMAKEVNIKQDLVPSGIYCRRKPERLNVKFITIHTTQNASADAEQHSLALKRGRIRGGKIGYLSWHFTVDDKRAVQHLPLTEIGHHADYGGPGNKYSIGIEMCEHHGNSMPITYDRSARLTAVLMKRYNVPLRNVVPHYYWTGKNCPLPLLENGVPGQKWSWFLSRVDYYYRCINNGVPHRR